ncbi:hypothetical protein CAPTEDRAFT_191307 [Capitella teleta]|uniref:Uncharacterized protein n=1 Tax=Capitella teleta TaxID=283909 RepID=R7U6V8_CAPTE|nr:hypothetical protein CAPTEDRAFT_191307 [Capitella teleta]|eukprot:ELU01881.1 hypothetical protein CAPTEDRAFT_191307 [Capitella teleta]
MKAIPLYTYHLLSPAWEYQPDENLTQDYYEDTTAALLTEDNEVRLSSSQGTQSTPFAPTTQASKNLGEVIIPPVEEFILISEEYDIIRVCTVYKRRHHVPTTTVDSSATHVHKPAAAVIRPTVSPTKKQNYSLVLILAIAGCSLMLVAVIFLTPYVYNKIIHPLIERHERIKQRRQGEDYIPTDQGRSSTSTITGRTSLAFVDESQDFDELPLEASTSNDVIFNQAFVDEDYQILQKIRTYQDFRALQGAPPPRSRRTTKRKHKGSSRRRRSHSKHRSISLSTTVDNITHEELRASCRAVVDNVKHAPCNFYVRTSSEENTSVGPKVSEESPDPQVKPDEPNPQKCESETNDDNQDSPEQTTPFNQESPPEQRIAYSKKRLKRTPRLISTRSPVHSSDSDPRGRFSQEKQRKESDDSAIVSDLEMDVILPEGCVVDLGMIHEEETQEQV